MWVDWVWVDWVWIVWHVLFDGVVLFDDTPTHLSHSHHFLSWVPLHLWAGVHHHEPRVFGPFHVARRFESLVSSNHGDGAGFNIDL